MQQTGFISGADSDRVQYEWNAATSAEAAAQKRLEETKVEHDAVADGVFIGDSYNDSPSSIQRETELKMKKGELDAQLAGMRTQITHINDQIAEEEARFGSVPKRRSLCRRWAGFGRCWSVPASS